MSNQVNSLFGYIDGAVDSKKRSVKGPLSEDDMRTAYLNGIRQWISLLPDVIRDIIDNYWYRNSSTELDEQKFIEAMSKYLAVELAKTLYPQG